MNLEWERLKPTEITNVGWRTIVTKRFKLPDGNVHDYATKESENSHCIAAVALTTEGKVIVARQYRPGPERIMFELPGGGANAGEDWAEASARELLEETGYQPGKVEALGDIYKDAYTNTVWHYFLATGCVLHPDGASPDEREFIEVCLISVDELFENARNGLMTDSEGVFLAYEKLKKIDTKQ
jgi:ADP-ribose pyrophosphatase